jgi:hypothetical protein
MLKRSFVHPSLAEYWPRFRFPLLLMILLVTPAPRLHGQTILNTERFQLTEVTGPHLSSTFSFTGRRGNSQVLQADASGMVGWRLPEHWVRLIYGGGWLSNGEQTLLDNRFVQLRYSWIPNDQIQTFHFIQAQKNETLRLRSRWLVGSGVQGQLWKGERASLSAGTGAMAEWERLDPTKIRPEDDPRQDAIRMANLAVFRAESEGGARLLSILYVQPRFSSPGDLRILQDVGVSFPVTERVRFTSSMEWRHDTRPPGDVRPNDLIVRTGITLEFR